MNFFAKISTLMLSVFFISVLSFHNQSFAQIGPYHDASKILYQVEQAAKKGKVINSQWGVGTEKSIIIQKYGIPDHGSSKEILYYAKRHLAFSFQQEKV